MSEVIQIPVELRETRGKGASRRLRRQDKVPGIVYGGKRPPQAIQLAGRFIARAVKSEAFFTSILEIEAEGRTQKVILRDLQRHPVKSLVMHVDFQRIDEKEQIRMSIPLHFVNADESPAGRKSAVVISQQMNEVEVSCLPGNLPEYIEVDLGAIDVGDSVLLRDIQLPEGVILTATISENEEELNRAVVSAVEVKAAPTPSTEEAEGLAAAEGVEGVEEAAAPEADEDEQTGADDGSEET